MPQDSISPTLEQPQGAPVDATRLVSQPRVTKKNARATVFRPMLRPPMATLELLDDGQDSGETWRLRSDQTTIGREGADIRLPHDSQISANHVAVIRRQHDGQWLWLLKDLKSTNGTFLRVARCPLGDHNTVLLGAHRYRYRPAGTNAPSSPAASDATNGWRVPGPDDVQAATASLVRLFPDGSEKVLSVPVGDVRIGSDASQCQISWDDDPMVDPVHGVIKSSAAKPVLEDLNSTNGIWVSVRERRLAPSSMFQIGEQRVRFRIL